MTDRRTGPVTIAVTFPGKELAAPVTSPYRCEALHEGCGGAGEEVQEVQGVQGVQGVLGEASHSPEVRSMVEGDVGSLLGGGSKIRGRCWAPIYLVILDMFALGILRLFRKKGWIQTIFPIHLVEETCWIL